MSAFTSRSHSLACDTGILIRRCKGRKDFTGERNHFASLSLLDDLPALAARIEAVLGSEARS